MLSKLKKIELRKAWNNEASDFTIWLSEEENIALLSDEIGIDIKVLETEASVGKFNVDILAEEENTGRTIIIENQLEPTNHDHLGKVITYASGYDAEIIIWIVKEVRAEHKQAIDWLNVHSDEKTNFFAIKMELWQIGDSPFAPNFQIVSQPNDWAKAIKSSTARPKITETKIKQFEFWNKFKEYSKNKGSKLKLRKVYHQHWYDISIGSSEAHIALTINTQENLLGCELYIVQSKELFNGLEKNKSKIEAELNEELKWMELPERKASRIRLTRDADINDTDKWEDYSEWLKTNAEKFQKVFHKYIKELQK